MKLDTASKGERTLESPSRLKARRKARLRDRPQHINSGGGEIVGKTAALLGVKNDHGHFSQPRVHGRGGRARRRDQDERDGEGAKVRNV